MDIKETSYARLVGELTGTLKGILIYRPFIPNHVIENIESKIVELESISLEQIAAKDFPSQPINTISDKGYVITGGHFVSSEPDYKTLYEREVEIVDHMKEVEKEYQKEITFLKLEI